MINIISINICIASGKALGTFASFGCWLLKIHHLILARIDNPNRAELCVYNLAKLMLLSLLHCEIKRKI